jgi:hypothetical protein
MRSSLALAWAIVRFLVVEPVSFVLVLLLSPLILLWIVADEWRADYVAQRSAKRKEFLNHFK